jgi:hypothetical protein
MSIIKKYQTYIAEKQELVGGKADDLTLMEIAKKHQGSDSKYMLNHLKSQLEKGVKVEMEHTSDISKCKEIAMDHLTEDPNYYDRLSEMEKDAEDVVTIPKWNTY